MTQVASSGEVVSAGNGGKAACYDAGLHRGGAYRYGYSARYACSWRVGYEHTPAHGGYAAGVQRYVQQSIVMAYADGGEQWLDERAPLDRSPARAIICAPVIAMEDMVRAVPPARLQWCILRGGNFVGPGTAESELIARLRAGRVVVRCDGRNFLSLVHVADMARAVCMALESAPASSVFNIVDEPLRNGEYMDQLAGLVGAPQPARDATKPCPPSYRCSNQAAGRVLGWMPVHGIWPTEQHITP